MEIELFESTFRNIESKYDIIIGLLYINKSHQFYQSKGFVESTPLVFRLPMNPLRNLAEYQVSTEWTFNIDVDFWYLSTTLNENVNLFINEMTDIVNVYGEKSIFIIPSFEVNKNKPKIYSSLNKTQLLQLINEEKEMIPFHFPNMNPQQCTDYVAWYGINKNYAINYKHANCSLYYEPWYIMNTNLSRNVKYEWDNKFIGRGYSKTSRVNTLRHYCFNFVVMKDLFIIHAAHEVHVKLNQTLRNKWTGKNRQLLVNQMRLRFKNKSSCLTKPFHVKVMHFLRHIFFGFAQLGYDEIKDAYNNYHCNGQCKC